MWIADTARSREIDRLARDQFDIRSRDLMEQAGMAAFEAAREMLPHARSLAVVCGKGNNGGDGLVVARLAKLAGLDVKALVAAQESELSEGAAEQLAASRAAGVHLVLLDDPQYPTELDGLMRADLIVDALLGIGASGDVKGSILDAIQAINRSGVATISIDVPSGIDCDTGMELGESVWACRTVTFGLPKPYLFQGLGLEHSGYWTVDDIGLPCDLLDYPTEARLLDACWVGRLLPERLRASHKGENGSILIVAGSERMPGAASLAARAAIRSGVGLVTVAGVRSVLNAVAAQVPEAILLPLPEHQGAISADAAHILLDKQLSYRAALFGPGLTHEQPVLDFLARTWSDWKIPACIDADALNAVAQGIRMPIGECVLTPHPGEMSRLIRCSTAEVQADRFQTVAQAVQELQKTILLKGPYSIVCEPFQPMLVNCTGNPGMASAGMGDVLGGVITTLLGQDLPGYFAASCGMYWHGMAGDLCAQRIGPIGFSASDVADSLPAARATITSICDEAPSRCSP